MPLNAWKKKFQSIRHPYKTTFIINNFVGEEIKGDLSTKKIARPPEYCNTLWGPIVNWTPDFLLKFVSDEPKQRLALVFELMERNMYEHIKERKQPLEEKRVKKYLYQLIKGLEFIHR